MARSPTKSHNRLLASLSADDIALLRPDLEAVPIEVRHVCEEPNRAIKDVYFLETGIASVVATMAGDKSIEIGIIGREGMTGAAVVMGNDRSPYSTYVQVAGRAQRMRAQKLREAINTSATLRTICTKWTLAFNVQTSHTAISSARATVEQRLARWLLMAHDRLDGDALPLTHEFLSLMLAVRRPGVTVALQGFERRKLIRSGHGIVTIVDRDGIAKVADGFYGVPERELRRLMRENR